jgi:Ecdysteroid kinase-like family
VAGDNGLGRAEVATVPSTAEQLTPAWLTAALRPAFRVAGEVAEVRASPIGVGIGLVGTLHRLDLTWTDGHGPEAVVAKLPAVGARSRAVGIRLGMYRNEVRFYQHLAGRTALAVTCHYAALDDSTHDFVLVMDDMTPASSFDQVAGCPPDLAAAAVTALADHHARFWRERGLGGQAWLRRLSDASFVDPIRAAYERSWPLVRQRFGPGLPTRFVALADRFASRLPALAAELSTPPCTLSHGDFRLDNMFIGQDREVRMCDWQLVDRSRGLRDLAYFLSQSLTPTVRSDLEWSLLALYLGRLADSGVSGYDLTQARHDYRVGTLFALVYPVVAGGSLELDDPRAAKLTTVILERAVTAISDLDCFALG